MLMHYIYNTHICKAAEIVVVSCWGPGQQGHGCVVVQLWTNTHTVKIYFLKIFQPFLSPWIPSPSSFINPYPSTIHATTHYTACLHWSHSQPWCKNLQETYYIIAQQTCENFVHIFTAMVLSNYHITLKSYNSVHVNWRCITWQQVTIKCH